MSQLENDLRQYSDEFFTKKDLEAGLKLIGEIAGITLVLGTAWTFMTVWMPAIGWPIATGTALQILYKTGQDYANYTAEERKQIRAAVKWIKGGFTLGSKLLG